MFGHAWHSSQIHRESQTKDEVIVEKCPRASGTSAHHGDLTSVEVNPRDGGLVHVHVRIQMTNGIQDVTVFNGTGDDFVKHRLKHEGVLLVDQMDF
jgi:hypothetical protein